LYGFDVELIRNLSNREESELRNFLHEHGLRFEGNPDVTLFVKDPSGRLAATGSLQG
jgi:extradiol dioxygenase family protein